LIVNSNRAIASSKLTAEQNSAFNDTLLATSIHSQNLIVSK